jgi:hypothetical protein
MIYKTGDKMEFSEIEARCSSCDEEFLITQKEQASWHKKYGILLLWSDAANICQDCRLGTDFSSNSRF